MSWLDSLSEAGGELLDSVTSAGGSWITGSVENDLSKQQASDPDEARKSQVEGQTADGQPLAVPSQGLFSNPMLLMGAAMVFGLVVVLLVMKRR